VKGFAGAVSWRVEVIGMFTSLTMFVADVDARLR
jgi:hypothetical protein